MESSLKLILSIALLFGFAYAQNTCTTAQNTNLYYNPMCSNPLSPYCTDTTNGMQCSPCNPKKTNQAICDCPANSICDGGLGSPTYGFCKPFSSALRQCATDNDCPVATNNGIVMGTWRCLSGSCRPCNQAVDGNTTVTCGGGWPSPQSSRPGETRQCGADGYWISGGQINVVVQTTTQSPIGTTTPPANTKTTTSGGVAIDSSSNGIFKTIFMMTATAIVFIL